MEGQNRFRKQLHIKDGEGTKWSYTFDNGETYFYSVEGVKPPEEIEDEVTTMFLWRGIGKLTCKKHKLISELNLSNMGERVDLWVAKVLSKKQGVFCKET